MGYYYLAFMFKYISHNKNQILAEIIINIFFIFKHEILTHMIMCIIFVFYVQYNITKKITRYFF